MRDSTLNISSILYLYIEIGKGIGEVQIRIIVSMVKIIGEREYSTADVGVRLILLLVISLTLSVTHCTTPQGLTILGLLRDWDSLSTARSVRTKKATPKISLK